MQIKVQQNMATRGSYMYMYMVKFSGASLKKKNPLQLSQNIDGFRQNILKPMYSLGIKRVKIKIVSNGFFY